MEFFDSSFGFTLNQLCLVLFAALLLSAGWSDAKSYTISNRLNGAIAALYIPYVLSAPVPVEWMSAVLIAGAFLVIGFGLFAFGHMGVSFPPKTGPLFLETEGGCDGSETTFGRGYTEASA